MEILALIFAAAALVWGTYLAMRVSLVAGGLVYLLAACVVGPHAFTFDAGITWSLDRLFLLALCGMFVLQWRMGRTDIKPLCRVDYLIAGLVGWLFASTFTHDWQSTSADQVPVVQHLINGYLIPVAIYFIARNARLTERNTNWILAAGTGYGIYLALTGVFELTGQWWAVFPKYIVDPEVGLHHGRARGPMVHSVTYGVYLTTCMVCAWLWRERLARHWQLLIVASMPVFALAAYYSKTRSVWLGMAAAALIVVATTLRGRIRVATLAMMIAAGGLLAATKIDSIMGVKREGSVQDTLHSSEMRMSFAYVSWLMFKDQPMTGFGFGQFAKEKLPYLADRSSNLRLEDIRPYVHHNTFLAVLTETGLIGLMLFLAMYAVIAWEAFLLLTNRAREHVPPWGHRMAVLTLAGLGIGFCQMAFHEITFTPLEQSLLFFLAGITVGLRHTEFAAVAAAPVDRSDFLQAFTSPSQVPAH